MKPIAKGSLRGTNQPEVEAEAEAGVVVVVITIAPGADIEAVREAVIVVQYITNDMLAGCNLVLPKIHPLPIFPLQ